MKAGISRRYFGSTAGAAWQIIGWERAFLLEDARQPLRGDTELQLLNDDPGANYGKNQ
jgi:hypothetical protein